MAAGQKYEAYDIRIIKNPDSENKEIDLKESQTVSMTLASPVAEDTNVTIKHIDDYGNLVSGEIDANVSEDRKTITFTAGSFSTYVLMYTPAAVADNDIAQEISAELRQTDAAGGPTDEYDLVIKSNDSSKVINEFLSSEWQFKITDDDGKEINSAVYEVEPAEYMKKVTKDAEGVITYELNLDRNASDAATGSEITIGKIKVAGRGKYNLSVVSGEVHTTKYSDNIVDDFVANASNTGNLTLPSSASTGELTAETGKLTINAAFNNEINDNKTDYQNMKLTISGGDLTAPIELKLGSDFVGDENTSLKWDNTEKQYTAVIDNQLTRNIAYNVQLEGAGYRTARYTVNMGSSDKILNFWNNVKDTADVIEVGSAASKAVTKNFLAGDILTSMICQRLYRISEQQAWMQIVIRNMQSMTLTVTVRLTQRILHMCLFPGVNN